MGILPSLAKQSVMDAATWLACPSTMGILPSLAKQSVMGTTTWLACPSTMGILPSLAKQFTMGVICWMYWASQSVKIWFFLADQLGMETYNSQPVHIEWNDTVTGPSANNSYNSILAKLGWPINNGELSSQLAGQQWVHSTESCGISVMHLPI